MNFGHLEKEIVAYLNSKNTNSSVHITEMPENESDFPKLFNKENLIVAFSDEEPAPQSKSSSIVYQELVVTFAILIQSKSLRGQEADKKIGIYELHSWIKKHLIGFQLSIGNELKYAGLKMLDKEENVFQFAVYFKMNCCEIEFSSSPSDDNINLLKSASLEST